MNGLALLILALAGAVLIGCAALDRHATGRDAAREAAHPPAGRLLDVGPDRIHVLELGQPRGTAPDLVLIHGANGHLADFTHDLTARLADDYRLLLVDRPGHGWSAPLQRDDSDPRAQARVLRAALAQLGLERPVVLGHSYGGAVAMAWALEAPQDTAALVILAGATYPWPGRLGGWYRVNETAMGYPLRSLVSGLAGDGAARQALAGVFVPDPVPPGYAAHFSPALSLRRVTLESATRQVNALNGHLDRMHRAYPDLTLPIELVHGDADRTVGLDIHSRRLAADVAGARLTVLPGTGHMPHHARPDETVAAIHRATRRAGLAPGMPPR